MRRSHRRPQRSRTELRPEHVRGTSSKTPTGIVSDGSTFGSSRTTPALTSRETVSAFCTRKLWGKRSETRRCSSGYPETKDDLHCCSAHKPIHRDTLPEATDGCART